MLTLKGTIITLNFVYGKLPLSCGCAWQVARHLRTKSCLRLAVALKDYYPSLMLSNLQHVSIT